MSTARNSGGNNNFDLTFLAFSDVYRNEFLLIKFNIYRILYRLYRKEEPEKPGFKERKKKAGNKWAKNNVATDGALLQYTSADVLTGISAEVTRSLRLDALSGDTVGFTINQGTASEESFVGATLTTTGLNVLATERLTEPEM